MKKLMLILMAFLAVFTYIRAFERTEAAENTAGISSEIEIPVEIIR